MAKFDALLFVSFGGPEGPDDVIPFLENVLRGKNVPHDRMMEVAEHYQNFGGVSPINAQNRLLISAIENELKRRDLKLPVYWGNRNWNPLIPDALIKLKADGHQNILTFMTSAYSSYSSCRQYHEDLEKAQVEVGDKTLSFSKIRAFFNHPGFINSFAANLKKSLDQFENPAAVRVLFTAHSIPNTMADRCQYVEQLEEACRLVAHSLNHDSFELVFQSRSGPPQQPWLEPDICDRITDLKRESDIETIVVAPIGFISDHIEVLFDLDTEAKQLCDDLGIQMERTETVGVHSQFVEMIVDLISERMSDDAERVCLGSMGAGHDECPVGCCPSGRSQNRPVSDSVRQPTDEQTT